MKNFFLNALVIGGVLPLILFGVFNFFYKVHSEKLSIGVLVLSVVIGVALIAVGYDLFSGTKKITIEIFDKNFVLGIGIGMLWGIGVLCVAIAFKKFNANASQIIPILNANSLVTVFLAIIFLKEKIIIWKILTGTILILMGTILLV